ncbi:ATP-binding protein [Pedobacter antarcticus]|uniref:PAS domain-containing sensor histidine kinase n=1 Tax=Pedobacter antarcticus TaxID=34086 RepID=UPI002931EA25|nr:ATP-binding protein [Pedobacter antarcticus]
MNLPKDPFFQALFHTPIPRMILKANVPDFTIMACNQAFKDGKNLQGRDITNQSLWDSFILEKSDLESLNKFRAALIGAAEKNEKITLKEFKYSVPNPDGTLEPQWWHIEIVPVSADASQVDFLLFSTYNITEQLVNLREYKNREIGYLEQQERHTEIRQLNKKLEISESRAKYLISEAPVAIGLLSGRNMIIDSANNKMLEIWGKNESIIGLPVLEALPEIIDQPFPEILDEVYTTGTPYYGNEKKAVLEYDGELKEVYLNFVYQPMTNQEHQVEHIMVVAANVTETVLARKSIERAEEMLRLAINSAALGTWYIDANTREFIPSARMKEFFGFEAFEEMTYEAAMRQIEQPYRNLVIQSVEEAIATGTNFDIEHPVIGRNDGKLRWLKSTGRLYPVEQGKPANFSGTILEITERKQDEQRKNDFISMVSHELKTPLTSLTAYIQLLLNKAEQQQDDFTVNALSKANQQVKKMAVMINGFLNVSRIGSGKIYLTIQEFDFSALANEVIDEMLVFTNTHKFIFMPSPEIIVSADRDKIGQVISNFLSNAVKYSPSGKDITISCSQKGKQVELQVKDQGIGISVHDQQKLFERFYRIENKHTAHISGFGIGLYLCAEIIQRHQGKIWVESTIGCGSEFHFSLPLTSKSVN